MAKTRLVSDVITQAGVLLSDAAKTRWPEATLIPWINEGQLAITILDARANRVVDTIALVAGYRQTLPADCLVLLQNTYNGAGGVVTPVTSRQQLDLEDPGWTTATGDKDAVHLIPPPPGVRDFVVYPVQPAVPGTLEIEYGAAPALLTASADTLGIEDEYLTALVNYTVFRAQQQDDDNMQDVKTSDRFYQAFVGSMPHQPGAGAQ